MKSNSHEARWGLRLAPSPFQHQLLSADFKLSFILPIKPKHFPFLRLEDGFHFLQKLKDNRKSPGWRDGKFVISRSHFFSSSSNGSIHSFFIILNDFPNHSVENFSFHSFSNFSKSNPRSITIPSIASIEDKNSVLSKFPPRKAKRKSLNVFS